MAEIRPFHGLRYNLQKVHEMGDVISPPYDVISADQKRELQARNPYNVVRLILPDGDEPYENAKNILKTWIHEGILVTEKDPAIYCYHQTYVTPENAEVTRRGFIALIRLEE